MFDGWQKIDNTELQRGEQLDKTRNKITDIQEMIDIANQN